MMESLETDKEPVLAKNVSYFNNDNSRLKYNAEKNTADPNLNASSGLYDIISDVTREIVVTPNTTSGFNHDGFDAVYNYDDSPQASIIRVRTSGTHVRPKEIVLVTLAFLLLAFSVALFFKYWKINYWDINQLPYFNPDYEEEAVVSSATHVVIKSPTISLSPGESRFIRTPTVVHRPSCTNAVGGIVEGATLFGVACKLSRSHSARYPNSTKTSNPGVPVTGGSSGSGSRTGGRRRVRRTPNSLSAETEPFKIHHKRTLSDVSAFKSHLQKNSPTGFRTRGWKRLGRGRFARASLQYDENNPLRESFTEDENVSVSSKDEKLQIIIAEASPLKSQEQEDDDPKKDGKSTAGVKDFPSVFSQQLNTHHPYTKLSSSHQRLQKTRSFSVSQFDVESETPLRRSKTMNSTSSVVNNPSSKFDTSQKLRLLLSKPERNQESITLNSGSFEMTSL